MKWSEFLAIPNGTRVFNHGYDQCVALANLYHEQVIGGAFVPVNSAYQWSTDFQRYLQLTNNYTHLPAHANPLPGDIFVSRGGIYNSRDGHIGIVVTSWNGSTFGTKEQNAERNRYTWQTYNRTKQNILGFLRPKTAPAPSGKKNKKMLMIHRKDSLYAVMSGAFWLQFQGQDTANKFAAQLGVTPTLVSDDFFEYCKAAATKPMNVNVSGQAGSVDSAAIAKAVNDEMAKRLQS